MRGFESSVERPIACVPVWLIACLDGVDRQIKGRERPLVNMKISLAPLARWTLCVSQQARFQSGGKGDN